MRSGVAEVVDKGIVRLGRYGVENLIVVQQQASARGGIATGQGPIVGTAAASESVPSSGARQPWAKEHARFVDRRPTEARRGRLDQAEATGLQGARFVGGPFEIEVLA